MLFRSPQNPKTPVYYIITNDSMEGAISIQFKLILHVSLISVWALAPDIDPLRLFN